MRVLANEARIFLPALIEEIDNIVEFTSGITFEQFEADKKTRYAFRHALSNASEAASNIRRMDPEAERKFKEIPFKHLINMRNRVVHKYWDVDEGIMYATATTNISALQKIVRSVFADDISLMKDFAHESVLNIISSIHGNDLTPEDVNKAIEQVLKVHSGEKTKDDLEEPPEPVK